MIIDCHTHILPPKVKEDRRKYIEQDAAFGSIYREPKAVIASADDLIDSMDRHEVSFSVAVNYSWSTLAFCRESNDYILESAGRFPGRIAGFCAVPDFTSDSSLREIERCGSAGARGIGELRADYHAGDFRDTARMKPFAELLAEHKLMLMLHASEPVGHMYPGKGTATPELLAPFLQAYNDIITICAHWGGGMPFYFLMPEVKAAMPNVYFDTAASPFLYTPQVFEQVGSLAGAGRILFGSDYPLMPPSRIVAELGKSGLSPADSELVMQGNARRLLGLN